MLLALHAPPTVSMTEVEIRIPDLVAKYAVAIGEPVEVLPAVRHRAVAIFAKNEPWETVMALAGEATGFRIARKNGRLRVEATRFPSVANLEKSLNAKVAAALREPADVQAAAETQATASKEIRELEVKVAKSRSFKSGDAKRLAELRGVVAKGLAVSSPGNLVLSRYLARGGKLPLAEATIIDTRGLIGNAEYRLLTGQRDAMDVSQMKLAARLTVRGVQTASRLGSQNQASHVSITEPSDQSFYDLVAGLALDEKTRPSPLFARGWTVGDYLHWMHRSSGRSGAAPALRAAVYSPADNGVWSLSSSGFHFTDRGGGIVITTELGDGFWPDDFVVFDRLKNPGLREYAIAANALLPSVRSYLSDGHYQEIVARNDAGPLGQNGPLLRALVAASPAELALLQEGTRLEARRMTPPTIAALLRSLGERDLGSILNPLNRDDLFIEMRDQLIEGTRVILKGGSAIDAQVKYDVANTWSVTDHEVTHIQALTLHNYRVIFGVEPGYQGMLRFGIPKGPKIPYTLTNSAEAH